MHTSPPLVNKITPITVGNVLQRDRLFALLRREPPTAAFWISGPGGCGKTTLIASYLAHEDLPCLWYQVDALDGDPATFFYYFGQAAATLLVPADPPMPLLTPEYLPNIETFILRYFENLYQRLQPGAWIVFDNFQDAPDGSILAQILTVAIQQAPPHVTLAVLSRSTPPPVMVRLFANRAAQPITGNQLAFTPGEFAAFLAYCGHRMNDDEAEYLYQLTQGWIAGAILWLLYRADNLVSLAVPADRTTENIFDYFAAEILEKTDATIRAFLLRTAFLPSMTIGTALEMSGLAQTEGLLEILYRRNCFLEKRLITEVSYQYHPLFRRFLLLQAERFFDPKTLQSIRCAAADILVRQGMAEEAVQLYFQAQTHDRIEAVLLSQAPALINQGRHAVVAAWIDRLPENRVEQHPYLLFWKSVALLAMSPWESNVHCTRAYELFGRGNDLVGQVLSWSTAVNILFILRHTFTSLDYWITEGERLGKLLPEESDADLVGRFAAGMLMALILRNQSHEDLIKWQGLCETMLDRCKDPQAMIDLVKNLCWSYVWMGQIHKTLNMETRLRLLQRNENLPPLGHILANHLLATCYISRGEHRECHRMVNESLRIVEATGIHVFNFPILTSTAYSRLVTGNLEEVPPLLAKLKEALVPYALWDHGQYHCLAAWYAVQADQLAEAKTEIAAAIELAEFCGSPFPIALCRLVESQVHLQLGEPEAAMKLMATIRQEPRLQYNKLMQCLVDLVSTDCGYTQNREDEAERYCRAALAFIQKEGPCLPFGLSNRRLGSVCAKALEAGIEEETIMALIGWWQIQPPKAEKVSARWPWPVRLYTLGRFAIHCDGVPVALSAKTPKKPLELLALLVCAGRAGMSRERLADRLWPDVDGDLALQTLNTTLHRLRKLLGRNEAVVQRDRQLLLNSSLCWSDSWHFQWQAQQIETTVDQAVAEKHITRALELYQGAFMPDHRHLAMVVGYAAQLDRQRAGVVAAALPSVIRADTGNGLRKEVVRALTDAETATVAFPILLSRCKNNGSKGEALDIMHRCRTLLVEQGLAHGHRAMRQIDQFLHLSL